MEKHIYIIDKKYAFVSSNFVLLTPESNWYPVAGLPSGTNFPDGGQKDFVDFKLTVNTNKNLTNKEKKFLYFIENKTSINIKNLIKIMDKHC